MVQETQSVLEALVVPGIQNKPENTVREPIRIYSEILALCEQQMSTKIWKASYFYLPKMPQSARCSCTGAIPWEKRKVRKNKSHRVWLIEWPVQWQKAP